MADFKTHLLGAALVSGVAAAGFAMTRGVTHQEGLTYFSLGVVGGLLPDIDSENSVPIRIAHRLVSTLVALVAVLSWADRYSLLELILLGLGCYALVRYGVFSVFSRLTVHRGLVHSVPTALLSMVLTASVMVGVFGTDPLHAWLCGGFLTLGFFVHLALDEMYSIDLLGRRFKRSFGTAIKVGDFSDRQGLAYTAMLYGLLVLAFMFSPPREEFLALVGDGDTYRQIYQRLLPDGSWFAGLLTAVKN